MTRRERNRQNKKNDHARRCPNCGERLPGKPVTNEPCKDCKAVLDLINARLARYTARASEINWNKVDLNYRDPVTGYGFDDLEA